MRGRLAATLTVLLAIGCPLALPDGAPASYPQGLLPNWPALLPANPHDSSGRVRLKADTCPSGSITCPAAVIDEMRNRWLPLDRSCDHRAVFALTYMRTTQEFFRTEKGNPSFFSDDPWINHEDATFAQLYFRAYDRYVAGRPVPAAWRIAFDAAQSPNVTGMGDLLLGMNAHINRDLPYALADVGLVKPDGSTRKPDHDRVNLFLDRVIDPLQRELAHRYDALFALTDAEPSPADEITALHAIRAMRENAWRNAERLVNARTFRQRQNVERSIELEAELGAETILASNTVPGYGPIRDAHCRNR